VKISGLSTAVHEPQETVLGQNPVPQSQTHSGPQVGSISQAGPSRLAGLGFQALGADALFKALGLPADRLSASIISFAKFFSLQLDPGILAKIRGQASLLANNGLPGQASLPGHPQQSSLLISGSALPAETVSSAALKAKEALALAGLAATDKGLELTQAGLEEYAAAIDPDRRQGADNSANRKNDSGRQSQEEQSTGSEESPGENEILKAAEASPALKLLNWLPGKNGQRWLVFPFSFSQKRRRFRASLRILLGGADAGSKPLSGRMSLDIAETAEVEKRWLFTMSMNKQGQADLKVMVHPPRRQRGLKILAGQLSRSMGMPPDSVVIQNFDASFPFAPDCRFAKNQTEIFSDTLLPLIEKEV
jgi:hypothetical protein